ncbi:DNA polymerase ligase N-terminal domain-containing protein [Streptomyces sp. 7-21]|uniref:DNA polymerase ligase N-terminal domain-containing protein n=1 Tax=Streptomyces sp. 7-21 TaxID=2802283 RepID=UPI0027DCDD12|nr:DNA polymerase ligase N-terminal domain-containing protein [Streptomyces sp. 7-21]
MTRERPLDAYLRRRDFARTAEPRGGGAGAGDRPCFVVQLHDARRVHFDFRLEADGVLMSWAVPKGPSADPGVKRLAMPTEDHPLAYRDFEGVIPQGEYGAGPVIIWDEGTWEPEHDVPVARALRAGHLSFRLAGRKLRGGWALTRFRDGGPGGRGEAWLLVKRAGSGGNAGARGAPDPARARSARSGRTLGQVRREAERAG